MNKKNRVNPDPYHLRSLCRRYIDSTKDLLKITQGTIGIIPRDKSKSPLMYKKILEDIKGTYPGSELVEKDDGNLKKIKIISNGYGTIKIPFEKKTTSRVLRPGIAYEMYFHSVLLDGITALQELREEFKEIPTTIFDRYNNLTLLITSGNKTFPIGPIKSAEHVGGKNEKVDIRINKKNGSSVNISLKQDNFFSWSSANTYDSVFSSRPKQILEEAIGKGILQLSNNKIIFPTGVDGIRIPATSKEVQNYAFGKLNNKVDYIIISAKKVNYNDNKRIIYMDAKKVYKNGNALDLSELMGDVYMILGKSSGNASALRPYQNVSVGYYNKSHAYNARDRKYIDL